MTDKAISQSEWDWANQADILTRRLPRAIPCFTDGAACPWCGHLTTAPTFGRNECAACHRGFCFGFPPWGETIKNSPESFIPFPYREYYALGRKASILPVFVPNETLLRFYAEIDRQIADQKGEPAPDGTVLQ